jgi:hypothetical protein
MWGPECGSDSGRGRGVESGGLHSLVARPGPLGGHASGSRIGTLDVSCQVGGGTPSTTTLSMLNVDTQKRDDVPGRSVWLRILGVVDSVLERLVEEPDGSVLAHVRPKRRQRQRCGICGQRCPLYDQGEGRRWCAVWI